MFRTIVAKFAGVCRRCGEAINVGETMRYGGYGRTYHLASACIAGGSTHARREGPHDFSVYDADGGNVPDSVDEEFRRQQAAEQRAEQAMDDAYAGTRDEPLGEEW